MIQIINIKIKQKGLLNKSDISAFINNSDLAKKIATKSELKAEQDKKEKLQTWTQVILTVIITL